MKKILYILIGAIVTFGIFVIFFPNQKIVTSCGIMPCEYIFECKGLYVETYNEQAYDGGAGGVCFGHAERTENEFFHKRKETEGSTKNTFVKFNVYYNNNTNDPALINCEKVYPVPREVPHTEAITTAALQSLIEGPTPQELQDGYLSNIPTDSVVNSLVIRNEVAYVDVNQTFFYVGGSCGTASAANALKKTLLQFPTIQEVKITINGTSLSEHGQGLI